MADSNGYTYQPGRTILLDTEDGIHSLEILSLYTYGGDEFSFSCVTEVSDGISTMILKVFDHTRATVFREREYGCPSITSREHVLSEMLRNYSAIQQWLTTPVEDGFVQNSEACEIYLKKYWATSEQELVEELKNNADVLDMGMRHREVLPYLEEELELPFGIEEMEEAFLYYDMRQMFEHEVDMFGRLQGLQGRVPELIDIGEVRVGQLRHKAILMEKMEVIRCGSAEESNLLPMMESCFQELALDVITLIHLFWHLSLQYQDFHALNLLLREENGRV